MIKIYKNTLQQKKLKKLKNFVPQSWLYVVDPTAQEISQLSHLLNIPHDILEDCVDEFELPRVEAVDKSVVVILRTPIKYKNSYITTPLTIIIHDKYLVTITRQAIDILEDFALQKTEIFTTQKSNFFMKACLGIISRYQAYITAINRSVQSTRLQLKKISKDDIIRLVENEEVLNLFIASLAPTISTIKKILHYNYINLYSQDKELIDDLLIDGEQVYELAITNLKTIKNIRDGYTTVMTINLNQIINILTYITAIFTIPTVIASIYGMNIRLPLAYHPRAFAIIMGINIVLMVGSVVFFIIYRRRIE